jgi:ribose 5-phosphate isomerase B
MNVAVGFDQRGLALRPTVIVELMSYGHTVLDLGDPRGSVDYATATQEVAEAILAGQADRGVVVSASGVGPSFRAGRIDGIRAGAPSDIYAALNALDHGMNLLCLGTGTVEESDAVEILAAFVAGEPSTAAAYYDGGYARSADPPVRLTTGSDHKV